jgi:hypothetical protein
MAKDRIHVTHSDDGWRVAREGAERASAVEPTKAEAIQRATEIAHNTPDGGEVVIHKLDGQISNSSTIDRRDPNPPRDRKQ